MSVAFAHDGTLQPQGISDIAVTMFFDDELECLHKRPPENAESIISQALWIGTKDQRSEGRGRRTRKSRKQNLESRKRGPAFAQGFRQRSRYGVTGWRGRETEATT